MNNIYYTTNMGGDIIAIKHGETGYYKTDFTDQAEADQMNKLAGVSSAEIQAAECCSMFDRWDHFADMVNTFNAKH